MQTVILTEVYTCYNLQTSIRMSVGLFSTITGLGRKNWRGGFREYYFGIPIENVINGIIAICQSSDVSIPSTTANEVGKYGKKTSI